MLQWPLSAWAGCLLPGQHSRPCAAEFVSAFPGYSAVHRFFSTILVDRATQRFTVNGDHGLASLLPQSTHPTEQRQAFHVHRLNNACDGVPCWDAILEMSVFAKPIDTGTGVFDDA
ncbi:hypothetical protein [Vibrio cincinnatiensis]|uniref:hypothetical protein n=1 Tax=Vibrio cincinnatiensis TaxID=675 RepID=UPI001EDEF86E|nr:hypothetical protein [Vibrio cincinnatiensis]MCG3729317.1 hypothetical protein [Vibrio cincinnatiensis]